MPHTALGRFAPTPSGRMHLGNVFAALLAWLAARAAGGRLLLRVEDLDLTRTSPAFTQAIVEDLAWLGLVWDEGPGKEAQNAPYLQSQRTLFYEEQLAKLRAQGLVYSCFCSRAQLHAASAPHQSDGNYIYDGRCRALTPQAAAQKALARPPALRVRVPDETVGFTDLCQGYCEENLQAACGDFILRRSDGVFAYQLAATADDGAMGVTQVVRGRDLLASTPRQIWLLRKLGYTPPQYGHVPLLLAQDGRRLSKRDADLDIAAIRARVKGPQVLVGALAHLAGLTKTAAPVAAAELVGVFHWGKVRKTDIVLPAGFAETLYQ